MNTFTRRLFILVICSCLLNRVSAVEFTFGDFTCDDLGTTISIIGYPDTAVGPVVIPQSIDRFGVEKPVTAIEVVAFDDVIGITNVVIPNSVTSIGSDAFARCFGLTSVTLPSSLLSLGANAFRDCITLTSITLPAGLTTIEESLFEGCSSLTSLPIPVGVTAIGPRAFAGCDGLVSIVIPFGVAVIETSTFEDCDGLTNVSIPISVTSIGDFAFFDCDSLISITIPASLINLGNGVFSDGALLRYAFFMGNAPTMGESVFDNLGINQNLRVYTFNGKTGFTPPSVPIIPVPPITHYWQPLETQPNFVYASISMSPESSLTPWLILNNLSTNSNLQNDVNGDGVNLLMAYALNLDPSKNLSSSLPQPVFSTNQMSLSFYAGSSGITYHVETCTDLKSWTKIGVTLSPIDAFQVRTATVSRSESQRFMRLVIEE